MTRRFLLTAAVAAAVLAIPAPAAHAGQICVKVIITGVVNQTAGIPCVSVGPATFCDTHSTGFPPTLNVQVTICSPMPLG